MIHAYSEEYLDEAMRNLGEAFDYARESQRLDLDDFLSMFIASGLAGQFEKGVPQYVAGMSGPELVLETLRRSGLEATVVAEEPTYELSSAYWSGWILAFVQWRSGRSFCEILELLPVAEMEELYPAWHETGDEAASEAIEGILRSRQPVTKLQCLRRNCRLTQRVLSEKSGVNLRTLQQYETGAKNINCAAGVTLRALSGTLGCRMEELLEDG
jgi:DNA-binding transcriptional regulator YiaG